MIRRFCCMALVASATAVGATQRGELVDRTLAIVGGQPVTLSDVRAAVALRLVDVAHAADPVAVATQRLIERTLVLREVQRYTPPEPADAAINAGVQSAIARLGGADAFRAALGAVGFSEALLRGWIRDDLRIADYLDQRFMAAGLPTDDEVAADYAKHRSDYEKSGTPFDRAAPAIRERLSAERRAELIADWISDLRRRTPVVELK